MLEGVKTCWEEHIGKIEKTYKRGLSKKPLCTRFKYVPVNH